ncbi:MAG: DUF1330 domain-containing protein [Myxococcota bacterium]|nr:DUF1330 domain-containing protein [Myxococcota bacterium]
MSHVEPDPQRLRQFLEEGDPQAPIVMINLLRYRERAAYPEGSDAAPASGREAYQRYGAEAAKHIAAVGGRMLWMGEAHATVIGPTDERWDDAILVEYPSKKAFVDMVSNADYQACAVHRTAALADSRLICTQTRAGLLDPE